MRCRKHEWFPLMRTASSIDEMLTFAFGRYGDYMTCSHCGLIGYVIHSRRSGCAARALSSCSMTSTGENRRAR